MLRVPVFVILISLGLLSCSPAPPQPEGIWRILGPGGGGAQFHPTVSPHDPNEVLVGCDMTGSYITHDAGASWRMFNLRLPARFFVFDPAGADTIYTLSGGLWRSVDAGETWSLVYPNPNNVTGLNMADDHAGPNFTLTDGTYGRMLALAIDPDNSNSLYAAIQEEGVVSLNTSADQGATWRKRGALPGGVRSIFIHPESPVNDRTLYVLGPKGVTVRKGGAWRTGAMPGDETFVDLSLGFPGGEALPVIYAVTESRVYASVDEGQSWQGTSLPGEGARLQAISTSLNHPDVAYVSYNDLVLDHTEHLGVAKSADRAKTWQLVWKDSPLAPGDNIADAWITERFGSNWGSNPFALGVGPDNPEICYGTDFGRTMRTTDGGQTWKGVYSTRQPGGGWVSTGLDVTTNYGVHFDPFDRNRVFITYTDIGLFGSSDGGKSWTSASIGIPERWTNTTYWIVFDPEVKGRVWGAVSGTHDLPRPKMWRGRSPGTFNGGVVVSHDGARTWEVSSGGLPETAATHIVLDLESPAGNRMLYVAGYGRGVFKSVDGGQHWEPRNNGIAGDEPFAWRFSQNSSGQLYLVVARRNEEVPGALYRSDDGAESWSTVPLPDGVTGPERPGHRSPGPETDVPGCLGPGG